VGAFARECLRLAGGCPILRPAIRALAALTAFVAVALLVHGARGDARAAGSLVECARAEAQRNFAAFQDYRCKVESRRKVWKVDGDLVKKNRLEKTLFVRLPDQYVETFVSGTINGKPEPEKEFIFERLGFHKGLTISDVECFRPGFEELFSFEEKAARIIAFATKSPGKTQLQTGVIHLAPDSCRVVSLAGRAVHKMVVRNEVDFVANFMPVAKSVWLPSDVSIRGTVSLGIVKRRIEAKNVYSDYKLNAR